MDGGLRTPSRLFYCRRYRDAQIRSITIALGEILADDVEWTDSTQAKEDTATMKSKLEERLSALKEEHETGQKMLADLDAKRKQLTDTMLRIEGAIQVLKDLLAEETTAHATEEAGAHTSQSS